MAKKLFVGNLPWSVTVEELTDIFSEYGEISDVHIPKDRETGRPRGFAFVEYVEDSAAETAIEELHEKDLGGRPMQVNEARPRD